MKKKGAKKPHGQIRQSQLITTFGPGAMVDLPNYSVLIAGLEYWNPLGDEIVEPRLVEKLEKLLGVPALKLRLPPPDPDDLNAPPTGLTVWQFPEWFITQEAATDAKRPGVRSRMLVNRRELTKGKFIDPDKKRQSVVPVRFVRACRAGHISDIDWYNFAHSGKTECRRRLWVNRSVIITIPHPYPERADGWD